MTSPRCPPSSRRMRREVVGVPPAVLEHGQQHPGPLCPRDELLGAGGGHRQGLVHHRRQPVVDCRGGQRHVGVVGGGDHHQVVVVALPQAVGAAQGPRLRVVACHHRLAFGAGRHDAGDLEPARGGDQGCMEDAAGESISDDRDAQVRHPPSIGSGRPWLGLGRRWSSSPSSPPARPRRPNGSSRGWTWPTGPLAGVPT